MMKKSFHEFHEREKQMKICKTDFGDIPISGLIELYANGAVLSCSPCDEFIFKIDAGELVPQYSTDDLRRKTVQSLHFYENGTLKSVPLEKTTPVFTPAGIISAEMVTFYESGKIKRVFPLNGKLSGYWAQEDEAALAEVITVSTPLGPVSAKVISLCFYEDGGLRSLTLWPGDSLTVKLPQGSFKTRVGISFGPDGKVKSLEPDEPAFVKTPIGSITAYDPDAVGINGDSNSLVFAENGNISQVVSTLTSITAVSVDGRKYVFTPKYRESLCGDGETEVIPMIVNFDEEGVLVRHTPEAEPVNMHFADYEFSTAPFLPQLNNMFGELRCSV